jgi:hypothetical protein
MEIEGEFIGVRGVRSYPWTQGVLPDDTGEFWMTRTQESCAGKDNFAALEEVTESCIVLGRSLTVPELLDHIRVKAPVARMT